MLVQLAEGTTVQDFLTELKKPHHHKHKHHKKEKMDLAELKKKGKGKGKHHHKHKHHKKPKGEIDLLEELNIFSSLLAKAKKLGYKLKKGGKIAFKAMKKVGGKVMVQVKKGGKWAWVHKDEIISTIGKGVQLYKDIHGDLVELKKKGKKGKKCPKGKKGRKCRKAKKGKKGGKIDLIEELNIFKTLLAKAKKLGYNLKKGSKIAFKAMKKVGGKVMVQVKKGGKWAWVHRDEIISTIGKGVQLYKDIHGDLIDLKKKGKKGKKHHHKKGKGKKGKGKKHRHHKKGGKK